MKVTIDIEVDQIMRQTLVEDWKIVKQDIKRLKEKRKENTLASYECEDIKDFKRYRDAMEVLIGYYFPYEESEKILKGNKEC